MKKKLTILFLFFITLSFTTLVAQTITVSGTVSGELGTPLPSVNIQVKGTNTEQQQILMEIIKFQHL